MESILIVDDDLNLCTVLKEELEEVGYKTNFVNSGYEAIDFLKNNPVDLILLDLKMPNTLPFKLLKDISAGWPSIKLVQTGRPLYQEGSQPVLRVC